jgi:hypothetical protein
MIPTRFLGLDLSIQSLTAVLIDLESDMPNLDKPSKGGKAEILKHKYDEIVKTIFSRQERKEKII